MSRMMKIPAPVFLLLLTTLLSPVPAAATADNTGVFLHPQGYLTAQAGAYECPVQQKHGAETPVVNILLRDAGEEMEFAAEVDGKIIRPRLLPPEIRTAQRSVWINSRSLTTGVVIAEPAGIRIILRTRGPGMLHLVTGTCRFIPRHLSPDYG